MTSRKDSNNLEEMDKSSVRDIEDEAHEIYRKAIYALEECKLAQVRKEIAKIVYGNTKPPSEKFA